MNILTQTQTNGKVRLDYIDALRGIAALMVLVCHSLQIDSTLQISDQFRSVFESCKYGVQLFFVISAFTIFYSLNKNDAGTYNFFIRRFFRIAPLYFVAVITYGLIYHSDGLGIALNLMFIHGFSPKYINSVVPGGWSIGIEMVFYCIVPFLFKKLTNLKRALFFFLVCLLVTFACIYMYRKGFSPTSQLESFVYFWLPNQLPVFSLGLIVYFLTFHDSKNKISELFKPLILLSLLIVFALFTRLAIFGEHLIFSTAVAVFIYLLKFKPFPGLINRVTLFLGKISYSLYLSQYAALNILWKTGLYSFFPGKTGKFALLNLSINLFLLFIVTSALAYILYNLIELPFQKMGRTLLREKFKPVFIETGNTLTHVRTITKKNILPVKRLIEAVNGLK